MGSKKQNIFHTSFPWRLRSRYYTDLRRSPLFAFPRYFDKNRFTDLMRILVSCRAKPRLIHCKYWIVHFFVFSFWTYFSIFFFYHCYYCNIFKLKCKGKCQNTYHCKSYKWKKKILFKKYFTKLYKYLLKYFLYFVNIYFT